MESSLDINTFSRAIPRPFGAANWVTLIRVLFAVVLLAYGLGKIWQVTLIGTEGRWLIVTGAAVALCLDGLDGFLARRFGQASAFGARFDMETDAVTMLALSILVWAEGQAGAWVLLSGTMRYIFVLGSWIWPALAAPLPARKRRQTLCVVQMIALILALLPAVSPFWGRMICLVGLSLLGYSFGIDLAWLVSRARVEGKAAC